MKSIKKQIRQNIKKRKKGQIVMPSDYEIEFGVENTKKALLRLTNEGFLERLARGIYLYPRKDNVLGVLYPDIETIAQEIANRDNARIVPTGVQALNFMGLSTQIPLNAVFLTDSSPRTIPIKNRTIKFKKTSPKNLSTKGHITGLAIQALKEIGKDKVTKEQIKKIKEQLKKEEVKTLHHDIKLAPSWIATIFNDLLAHHHE